MSSGPSVASSSKRKQPLTVNAGVVSTEQAGQPGGAPSTSSRKRVRYDDSAANEEVFAGENLDFAEQDRKRNQQGRKGRVVTDGYDSEDSDEDSNFDGSDDGDGKNPNGKVAGVDPSGDSDEDMFEAEGADASEQQQQPPGASSGIKTTDKKYLGLNEIVEGQEYASGPTGALSDESDVDEDRDPDLELESDGDHEGGNNDYDDDEGDEDVAAEGEKTPPLSPGGTTVLRQRRGKRKDKLEERELKRIRKLQAQGMSAKEALFADMGYKMDGFNMRKENEAGSFDTEGNYIAKAKDPHEEHDKWLTGAYSRKSIKAAKEAQRKRQEQMATMDDADEDADADARQVLKRTVEMMKPGETVLETLQRLGAEAKKYRSAAARGTQRQRQQQRRPDQQQQQKQQADKKNDNKASTAGPAASEAITALETFTSLTSTLMTRYNRFNLYDEEYELLLREVRRSGVVSQDWDPQRRGSSANDDHAVGGGESRFANDLESDDDDQGGHANHGEVEAHRHKYVYRYSSAYLAQMQSSEQQQDDTFGPFSLDELKEWRDAGYFGSQEEAENIELRRSEDDNGQFVPWRNLLSTE